MNPKPASHVAAKMKSAALLAFLVTAFSTVAFPQTVEIVHEFAKGTELTELTSSQDGELFGAVATYGKANSGMIYKLGEKDQIVELANFSDAPLGAHYPTGTLIADGSWLWGVTTYGGETKGGTVFRVHAFTGKLEIVAAIPGTGFCSDSVTSIAFAGSRPNGRLFKDPAGFLVGETESSITDFPGKRFRVNLKTQEFTVLGDLKDTVAQSLTTPDGLGNKWGVGAGSSKESTGAILKLAANGEITTEVEFDRKETQVTGQHPIGLTRDNRGVLWGVTQSGGKQKTGGAGTIFSLDPKAGEFRTVFEFGKEERPDSSPCVRLVKTSDGMLWGMASRTFGKRAIVMVNPATGAVTTHIVQENLLADSGKSTLMLHSDGNLYGTISKGASNRAILFRVRLQGTK